MCSVMSRYPIVYSCRTKGDQESLQKAFTLLEELLELAEQMRDNKRIKEIQSLSTVLRMQL